MFKKIALATAIISSASFATWDYFPVLEARKGTVEAGLYYDWHHEWSQTGIQLGARYSLVQNFEISLQSWGLQFWSEHEDDFFDFGQGLRDMTLGFRYQFMPIMNAFIDLNMPLGSNEVTNDEIALYFGAQFSMPFAEAPGLALGTEAGALWGFEHDGYDRGLEVHVGGELDYAVPNVGVTPFVGLQLKLRLTKSSAEDERGHEHDIKDNGDKQMNLWLGAAVKITPQLSAKGQIILRSGDQDNMGGDANGLYVACDYNF